MTETKLHGGILLKIDPQPLPDALADPIRERWQTDEDDDMVEELLSKAAAVTDAGAFLRPAKIGAPDGDTITLDGFPIRDGKNVDDWAEDKAVGDLVELTLYRAGTTVNVTLVWSEFD